MGQKKVQTILIIMIFFWLTCDGRVVSAHLNPHGENGDCSVCHVASKEKLNSWFTFGSTKRELEGDANKICKKCHTVKSTHAGGFSDLGTGHVTGSKAVINHRHLPLASDNTITCATTCHDVHVVSDDDLLQKQKFLRLPVNALCVSCHDK